jgi:hypothetical protein
LTAKITLFVKKQSLGLAREGGWACKLSFGYTPNEQALAIFVGVGVVLALGGLVPRPLLGHPGGVQYW